MKRLQNSKMKLSSSRYGYAMRTRVMLVFSVTVVRCNAVHPAQVGLYCGTLVLGSAPACSSLNAQVSEPFRQAYINAVRP